MPVMMPYAAAELAQASALVRRGGVVAFATETVYGLGANAYDDRAVAEVFAIKGRPNFNPLIIHVPSLAAAEQEAVFTPLAQKLAAAFWPGPLTLVLRRKPESRVSLLASAGLDTLALRRPLHAGAQALLAACGVPLAAPSANRSGRISATSARDVAEELGDNVPLVLDGGDCAIGIESTVVDATRDTPVILRHGAVTAEMLRGVAGAVEDVTETAHAAIASPGMLASHYAPSLPLRLNAERAGRQEGLLAFGAHVPEGAAAMENLSVAGDMQEAAANFFRMLRRLDRADLRAIAVMPVPETGLGRAINDRLRRAAAEK